MGVNQACGNVSAPSCVLPRGTRHCSNGGGGGLFMTPSPGEPFFLPVFSSIFWSIIGCLLASKAAPNPPPKPSFSCLFRRLVFRPILCSQNPGQNRVLARFGPVKLFKYAVITSVCSRSPFLPKNRSADDFCPLLAPPKAPKMLQKVIRNETKSSLFSQRCLNRFLARFWLRFDIDLPPFWEPWGAHCPLFR